MMFSKSIFVIALAFVSQVAAHAAIAPALGVKGTPARKDAQRGGGCGKTNIAATLDTSTAVAAGADGSFAMTVTNFNGGKDGSTFLTAKVDATGTGKSFVAATMTKNGEQAPKGTGSVAVTGKLPAGMACTGGKNKNLCLVSLTTAGGFGNCVVVSQGAGGAAAAGAAAAPPAKAAQNGGAAVKKQGGKNNGNKNANKGRAIVGTRAPRAIRRIEAVAA